MKAEELVDPNTPLRELVDTWVSLLEQRDWIELDPQYFQHRGIIERLIVDYGRLAIAPLTYLSSAHHDQVVRQKAARMLHAVQRRPPSAQLWPQDQIEAPGRLAYALGRHLGYASYQLGALSEGSISPQRKQRVVPWEYVLSWADVDIQMLGAQSVMLDGGRLRSLSADLLLAHQELVAVADSYAAVLAAAGVYYGAVYQLGRYEGLAYCAFSDTPAHSSMAAKWLFTAVPYAETLRQFGVALNPDHLRALAYALGEAAQRPELPVVIQTLEDLGVSVEDQYLPGLTYELEQGEHNWGEQGLLARGLRYMLEQHEQVISHH